MLSELWGESFANPTQRIFWVYLMSSLLIALLFTLYQLIKHPFSPTSPDKNHQTIAQQLSAYLLHPSALLDYRYFFVGTFIKIVLIAPLIISAKTIAIFSFKLLSPYIQAPWHTWSYEWIALVYTLSLFIISDLSRYALHRLLHSNRILWQFHKIHHSAPLLNPLTFYRVHPLENLLFGLRYAIVVGCVTGLSLALFGARLNMWTILGANGFIFIFSFLGTHLRHSHLFIAYPKWIETLFISPAMHQIHHYKTYSHYNYGGYLAIWDKLWGTWIPACQITSKQSFGISEKEMLHYKNIRQLLFQPFLSVFQTKRNP